jgi:sarcosine oxidase
VTDLDLDADVIVVGLGIHGSASAYALAAHGVSVIGLEQFEPAHDRGSSHGATRMIRRAYPNPIWNPLVDRAFAAWDRWSDAAGEQFVHTTGGLYAHAEPDSLQGPGCEPVDAADAGAFARLMPAFAPPEGFAAVYDPNAGVVEAARALAFAHAEATRLGAELRFGRTVLGWSAAGDDLVVVETDQGPLRARRLVLAVGAWVGTVVPELAAFFEVWRILTIAAKTGQPDVAAPALGTFSVNLPDGLVFGLPEVGGHGLKLGVDAGEVWDPRVPPAPPTDTEIVHLRALLQRFVPGADLESLDPVACLYTMTPDKRFVVGALPWASSVIVAAACSGHGFKFGPAIGDAVSDLVRGVARPDLDFLAVDRIPVAAPRSENE